MALPMGLLSTRRRFSSSTTLRSRVDRLGEELEVTHALGLELHREADVRGRHGVVIGGDVLGREGVGLPADLLEQARVLLGRDVLRALEHHVLEHVRDAADADVLVLRAHVIEDLHRRDGRLVVGEEEHLEAVGELPRLDVELGRDRGLRGAGFARRGADGARRPQSSAARRTASSAERRCHAARLEECVAHRNRAPLCHAPPDGARAKRAQRPSCYAPAHARHRRRRDRRQPRARGQHARRLGRAPRRRVAAAVVRARGDAALPGDLLARGLLGHGRVALPRPPLAARASASGSTGSCDAGAMGEVIVVAPDGFTRWGGSQYLDSPVSGGHATHLVRELVPEIDRRFRTFAARDARAIGGGSSGGFGALVLAMRHPEVFCGRREPRGRLYFELSILPDIPCAVAHAAPSRRRRGVPRALRARRHEARRRLHDDHDAGLRGGVLAGRRAPARRRAALRPRDGRARPRRVAALEGLRPRRSRGVARRGAARA